MVNISVKILFVVLITATFFGLCAKVKDLNNQLDITTNNLKAHAAENDELNNQVIVFKSTINDLTTSNDSLTNRIINLAKQDEVRIKKITSLQYQLQNISKEDKIELPDTIFLDPEFRIDTCIQDKWSSTCISLQYPGTIQTTSSFNNEQIVVFSAKRETIKPYKWWIQRVFAKKHTITEVHVINENPYVTIKEQRYIEIID